METVIVSNTLSRDIFPNNSGGEFTNDLNHSIDTTNTSVSISTMYYNSYNWYNVRQGTNQIFMKISGYGTYPSGELICSIDPGQYVDMYNLVEKVLYAMNMEIYKWIKYYKSDEYHDAGYDETRYRGGNMITTKKPHGPFEEWLERKGHWLRAHPQMFRFVHDGRYFGKGEGEVWEPYDRLHTPPVWDINLMDGRYIAAVIDKEKIVFKGRNVGFDLKFAFCNELAYLMGAAHNFGDLVWYHSKSMDKLYKEPKPLISGKGVEQLCHLLQNTCWGHGKL